MRPVWRLQGIGWHEAAARAAIPPTCAPMDVRVSCACLVLMLKRPQVPLWICRCGSW